MLPDIREISEAYFRMPVRNAIYLLCQSGKGMRKAQIPQNGQERTPEYTVRGVFIMDKNKYMLKAIELAKLGAGHVDPNPLVGAVIVKDDRIIGEGFHEVCGGLHAERNALKSSMESTEGAEIYVTLEPCCHYGKQPPCTKGLIEAGIRKVYIGSADPNPLVAGKGTEILKKAGIEVVEDFMRDECDALNPVFFHYITNKEPYVALKYAMTADGRIAADSGSSRWISGEEARRHVHKLRNYYKGIAVGIGTVLADDPMLNCRMEGGRDPVRIVFDTNLRIPLESRLVQTADKIPLIVIHGNEAEDTAECGHKHTSVGLSNIVTEKKKERLKALGVELIEVATGNGHTDLAQALKILGDKEINGILVEGGAGLNAAFIEAGRADRAYVYVGSKIFGGSSPRVPVTGTGTDTPDAAAKLKLLGVQSLGDDVLLSYEFK